METKTEQIKKEVVRIGMELNEKIKDGLDQYYNYLEAFKNEEFNENLNDTEEQSIKKAESIYDRLDEMLRRNDLANTKLNGAVVLLNKISNMVNGIVKIIESEKLELAIKSNEIIDIIIDLEKRKVDKLILQNPKKNFTYKGMLEDVTNEWNEHRIDTEERKRKEEEAMKRLNSIIVNDEINQIEKWTQMKMGNVIFDSDVDDWNVNTSVFDKRILNKSNLIFIIEDEIGNKFGGYVNAIINEYGRIADAKSFVFSLKSNGRLNGMLKFDIVEPQYAFFIYTQPSGALFGFGKRYDICIFKETYKNLSYRGQDSFKYNGIQNALCGKPSPEKIKPTRITVVQLI